MTRQTSRMTARVLLTSIALVSVGASHGVRAADTVKVQQTVSAAGLDLNTPAGARTLYARLKNASHSLCIGSPFPENRAPSWQYQACIEKALANAVRNSGYPLLTMAFVDDYGSGVAAKYGIRENDRVAKQ
jgi:UrcA family protein